MIVVVNKLQRCLIRLRYLASSLIVLVQVIAFVNLDIALDRFISCNFQVEQLSQRCLVALASISNLHQSLPPRTSTHPGPGPVLSHFRYRLTVLGNWSDKRLATIPNIQLPGSNHFLKAKIRAHLRCVRNLAWFDLLDYPPYAHSTS